MAVKWSRRNFEMLLSLTLGLSFQESESIAVERAPVIKKALDDQTVRFGEMADFEVSTEPNEIVVEWYSNGKQLIDGMPGGFSKLLKEIPDPH